MMVSQTPLVAISQRVDAWPDRHEQRDALDQRLLELVLRAGLIPVPVPNVLECTQGATQTWLEKIRPQGVVLSGGNDIGEFAMRDATEVAMIRYVQSKELPLLGICRGMQMLAIWAGTELVAVEGHIRTRHQLELVDKTTAWPEQVNSFHKFSIKTCPKGFKAMAYTQSGEIEAMSHQQLPWEAWMWHPERELEFASADLARIRSLFNV